MMQEHEENVELKRLESDENKNQEIENVKSESGSNYSLRYRIIKTILMVFVWICYGIEAEMFGPALQDLKIQLDTNYQGITRLLITRYVGYIGTMCVYGVILKRIVKYSDLIIAVSQLSLALVCFAIPWVRTYWLMILLFLVEGVSQTVLDVTGSTLILRLWKGVSNSPIIVVYGGYSIGGGLAVMLVKQFIKFNTISRFNSTEFSNMTFNKSDIEFTVNSNDIQLQIPYSAVGFSLLFISMFCFVAYFFEQNQTDNVKNDAMTKKSMSDGVKNRNKRQKIRETISNLLFDEVIEQDDLFQFRCIESILVFLKTCCFGAFSSFFTSFQFSYLTKGPAKLSINAATFIMTSFWFMLFFGRLISTFLACKTNPLLFFLTVSLTSLGLLVLNTIPQLNSIQLFHWIFMFAIGLSYSPITPGTFMIANYVLVKPSPVLISIVLLGLTFGSICAQEIAGVILDNFKPDPNWLNYYNDATSTYALPFIGLCLLALAIFVYLLLILTHIKTKSLVSKSSVDN